MIVYRNITPEEIKAGNKIVNNTDYKKYEQERVTANKNYKIGMTVEDKVGQQYRIAGKSREYLIAYNLTQYTNKGRLKSKAIMSWLNPVHIIRIIKEA